MGLIKSYGNYVIQKKHQLVNDGTIFERDYSTIGGIGDNFNSSQKVYQQGTFIYGLNGEIVSNKIYNRYEWESNSDGEYWNQENIQIDELKDNSLNILLKQDYYKLKEFAYYGSCMELIKNSLNDIIQTFPGELYVPYFVEDNEIEGIVVLTSKNEILGKDDYIYLVDNPFNLDIHTTPLFIEAEEQSNIKYIISNYSNYEIIDKNGYAYNINDIEIVLKEGVCYPYQFGTITIKTSLQNIIFHCYYDEKGQVCYLTKRDFFGFHIRPKTTIIYSFFKNFNTFQGVLLNRDSQPLYSAIFEVQEETDYGYKSFYEKFIFPIAEGGYNLDVLSDKYLSYINSLFKYASEFDNLYCNNLYRNMTHESIKNFDWTDVLQRGEETKEDYIENGGKIEQMLLLCGREIDEIKFYIDGIKNINNVSYDDSNNLPDYFLTDTLNIEGWDVINVFPLKIENNKIVDDLTFESKPYSNIKNDCGEVIEYPNGYFSGNFSSFCTQTRIEKNENDDNFITDNDGYLRERIKQYISDKSFSMQKLNDKFLKYLKLNSRYILQKKGTIEAIESLLSLFGLRSKRWYDSLNKDESGFTINSTRLLNEMDIYYDYEIKEYVTVTHPLEDKNSINNNEGLPKSKYLIDFFNSTKTLVYNTQNYKNGVYEPYQGLPIRYYEKEGERYLYPYFSYNIPIDGKPYFQMKGGWIHKNYHYSGLTVVEEDGGFIDTNTQISSVVDLKELLRIRQDILYDGIIYYVKNIKGYYVCVNDELYDIIDDIGCRYFQVEIKKGILNIGKQQWFGIIETYDESYNVIEVDTTTFKDGQTIKIFIKENNTIFVKQDDKIIINYAIFRDGQMVTQYDYYDKDNVTNYFKLNNVKWHNMLGFWGWNQIKKNDKEYKTLKSFTRNYNANNPHTNGFLYDNGSEYIKYFAQLFKYAISKETFDPNCYNSMMEYMKSLNYIETNVGFKNLINKGICGNDINNIEDKKIHHFCNIKDSSGVIENFYEFDMNVSNGYTFYDKEEYQSLFTNPILSGAVINETTCLDQIINIKNVDIIFKKLLINDEDVLMQRKYFDKVILYYLMQIIPSNVILNIKYE